MNQLVMPLLYTLPPHPVKSIYGHTVRKGSSCHAPQCECPPERVEPIDSRVPQAEEAGSPPTEGRGEGTRVKFPGPKTPEQRGMKNTLALSGKARLSHEGL
jgi:hypothetical protein